MGSNPTSGVYSRVTRGTLLSLSTAAVSTAERGRAQRVGAAVGRCKGPRELLYVGHLPSAGHIVGAS